MALFIQLVRSKKTERLMRHPKEFLLLTQIALRANRGDDPFTELAVGESMIGDHESIGLSKQNYRTAKTNIQKWNLATFRVTNRGTIAKLTDTSIYDINILTPNTQTNTPVTPGVTLQLTPNNNINNLITNTPPIIPQGGNDLFLDSEISVDKKKSSKKEILEKWLKRCWNRFYRRQPDTAWSQKELKTLSGIAKRDGVLTESKELRRFYHSGYLYHRKNIQTLLNNWTGELDKARLNATNKNNGQCGHTQTTSQSKFSGRF